MEYLSGVDAFWLRMDKPTNRLTVTGILRFAGPVTTERLMDLLERKLLRFPRFTQRVTGHTHILGRPRWEDDPQFALDRHVQHVTLPDGSGEAALEKLATDLMVEPLDEARALWSCHLVDGVGEGSSLIVRVHHALADGFSLIYLMLALVDDDCEVELPGGVNLPDLAPEPEADNEEHRSRLQAAKDFAQGLVEGGLKVLRQPLPDTGPLRDAAYNAARLFTMAGDSPTALRGVVGVRKVGTWSQRFSVESVKRAAHAVDGTVNDVLLAALAGAFRRYLEGRGHPVDGIDVRAVVPVNVRPLERRSDELGNGFGLVFLDLPAGQEAPADRLRTLKARMDSIKQSPEAFVTFGLMHAVGLLPGFLQEQLVKLFEGKSTAVVTNVPGPVSKVRMAGETVDDIIFFVPQSAGTGLGISIFSYAGFVRIGIAADAGLVPDPKKLVEAYRLELEELGVAIDDAD